MTAQKRFSEEWGMPESKVIRLVYLSIMYGDYNTKYSNGDRFPGTRVPDDKSVSSHLWGSAVDACSAMILDLVQPYGFTAVVSTGLGPTLKRGDRFVDIPY